jgi:hypothetical protein
MKTASPLFTLILSVVVSCTPIKNNETTVDSTKNIATDSAATQIEESSTSSSTDESVQYSSTVETAEPPIDISKTSSPNFPAYSDTIFTEDESEAAITKDLITLLREYKTRKLVKIKSTYSMTYPVGNDGDDSTEDATTTETKTWYYDINRKLSAYTLTSKSAYVQRDVNDGSERVSNQKTTIYLFTNEQLAAVYDEHESTDQIFYSNKERIVITQCPACGVTISEDTSTSEGTKVSPIDQAHVIELSKLFFEEHKKMLVDLQGARIERISGDNCFFSVQKPWDDRTYTLNYSSNQSMYLTLLKTKP